MDNSPEKHQYSINNERGHSYLNGPSGENTERNLRDAALSDNMNLGPLPPKWEKAYTKNGEVYFIDHNSSTSHWLDPRLSKFQKSQLEDCLDDELPFGWEKIEDPEFGTYYIDHVNRQTQYENPVLLAKNAKNGDPIHNAPEYRQSNFDIQIYENPVILGKNGDPINNTTEYRESNFDIIDSVKQDLSNINKGFTKNPHKLVGERIRSTLVKSIRGLGFTIIGGDDTKEEFLQIKSVVRNGPAWLEGKLRTGDVLVYVNDKCVLGLTHHDMVSVFQGITPGQTVCLDVCRGYNLPYDPNDPNTEVITTLAVGNSDQLDEMSYIDRALFMMKIGKRSSNDLCNQSVKSMPDLYASEDVLSIARPSSTDLILEEHKSSSLYLTMSIVKGEMGFGFTIADSAHGQKVKKILDKNRCQDLTEGDILMNINSLSVRNMSHNKVVQVLKDCQTNQAASITIHRHVQNSPDKFRLKNKKIDVKNLYGCKIPDDGQNCSLENNRAKTPIMGSQIQTSKTSNNVLVNGSSDTYGMNYDCRTNNYWTQLSSPSKMYIPTPSHKDMANSSTESYMDPPPTKYFLNSSVDHYSNHSSKSTQSVGYDHYEMNAAKNEARYLHNNNEINNQMYQINNDNIKSDISYITLQRQESGFGFRIVGGKEDGSQVSVGHIVPGGSADLNGRIFTGDELISIDGQSTMKTSHDYVINLMGQASRNGRVTIGVRHMKSNQKPNYFSTALNRGFNIVHSYNVKLTKNEKEGFGFVVISSLNKGPSIGRIIEDSPAFRDGQIHVGDLVLAVNNKDITNLSHGEIVNMIKDSGSAVTLTIGQPNDDIASTVSLPQSNKEQMFEDQYYALELCRGPLGFGFSIRGGREFQNMSLFVLQIAENGPAAIDGRLQIGDHIIEINGINTNNMTHAEAINIIHSGGSYVRLLIRRGARISNIPSEDNFYETQ